MSLQLLLICFNQAQRRIFPFEKVNKGEKKKKGRVFLISIKAFEAKYFVHMSFMWHSYRKQGIYNGKCWCDLNYSLQLQENTGIPLEEKRVYNSAVCKSNNKIIEIHALLVDSDKMPVTLHHCLCMIDTVQSDTKGSPICICSCYCHLNKEVGRELG